MNPDVSNIKKFNLKIFPDEVLREVCSPVDHFNGELEEIFREMLELMRANNGIGLAAPQVGITRRLFVCEIENRNLCLVNPLITVSAGESSLVEGCLSLPGVLAEVRRNEQVLVKGYDPGGKPKKFNTTGLWARVIQHENDHLNGILINDRGNVIEDSGDNESGTGEPPFSNPG